MIYYIGFYSRQEDSSRRLSSAAAVDKMNYIAQKLNDFDDLTVVSVSQTTVCGKVAWKKHEKINNHLWYRTFFSIGWPNALLARLELMFKKWQTFFFLLTHCSRKTNVIAYHSLYSMMPIRLAHRIRKFNLILEVEEIYQDVVALNGKIKDNEYKVFDDADAYIFSTEFLSRKLNVQRKPECIVYGNYNITPRSSCYNKDELIHIVFGGTLERSKGSILVAQASMLLPKNYRVHIAGNGPQNDLDEIKRIEAILVNGKAKGKLFYEGELSASDYERLLQKCHIGVCSQDPTAKYSDTSFPSKVLNYLRHGLEVVSIRIPTIAESALSPIITFYEKNEAHALADAIITASMKTKNDLAILSELDSKFGLAIKTVLK